MRWSLEGWIERVKMKPESVRQRYVIGCALASMFFVLIIWSLTVSENLKRTKTESADGAVAGNGILLKPSDFSLDDILSGEKAMEAGTPKSGEEFLREQVENRARLDLGEQGIVPKEAQSSEGALAR